VNVYVVSQPATTPSTSSGTSLLAGVAYRTAETTGGNYRTARGVNPRSATTMTPQQPAELPTGSQPVLDWLRSQCSQPYQGRWVALTSAQEVLAVADSPADFPLEVARRPEVTILFVLPGDATLVL
jgi:hypothetical protein